MLNLRKMTEADLDLMEGLMKANHEESYYKDLEYNKISSRLTFMEYIYGLETYAKVIEDKQKIIGYLLGFTQKFIFNKDKYASDLLLYVDDKYRGKLVGKKLLTDFEKWSKDLGCKEILLGTKTEITTERTKQLYNKLGYNTVGYLFSKKVN